MGNCFARSEIAKATEKAKKEIQEKQIQHDKRKAEEDADWLEVSYAAKLKELQDQLDIGIPQCVKDGKRKLVVLRVKSMVVNSDCATGAQPNREYLLLRKILESNELQVPPGVQVTLRHDSIFSPFRNAGDNAAKESDENDTGLVATW